MNEHLLINGLIVILCRETIVAKLGAKDFKLERDGIQHQDGVVQTSGFLKFLLIIKLIVICNKEIKSEHDVIKTIIEKNCQLL